MLNYVEYEKSFITSGPGGKRERGRNVSFELYLKLYLLKGAGRSRVVRVSVASPCDDWKTLSVNPAVNGYLFRSRDG